jgi:hypothetical protein
MFLFISKKNVAFKKISHKKEQKKNISTEVSHNAKENNTAIAQSVDKARSGGKKLNTTNNTTSIPIVFVLVVLRLRETQNVK